MYRPFKSEFIDARYCDLPAPDVDIGKMILMLGATSDTPHPRRHNLIEGIGRETARCLAISGTHLIITARDEMRGNRCVIELIEETQNPNIKCLYLYLCDFQSVEMRAKRILKEAHHLDLLLKCAGLGVY